MMQSPTMTPNRSLRRYQNITLKEFIDNYSLDYGMPTVWTTE